MSRRTAIALVSAAAALIGAASLLWMFWPREEPEVIVVWHGEPQFTQQHP